MPIVAECRECGAQLRFADADDGAMARCKQCGANVPIRRAVSQFEPAPKPKKKKKKRRAELKPTARPTDADRQAAIRAGESGARIMLLALLANLAAFAILALAVLSLFSVSHGPFHPNRLLIPGLGLFSSACLMAAMFRWRATAEAAGGGQIVQIGVVLGTLLFAVEVGRMAGVKVGFLDWLATYGRMVYFTLLVVYLERICVMADRSDLLDLTHRVLSCGVGVIGIALFQQFIVLLHLFFLVPLMAMLNAGLVILWTVWCVEYFRLLLYAVSLRR